MNVYQLERKCGQLVEQINTYDFKHHLVYDATIKNMDGYDLRARDMLDRIVFISHFNNIRELFQFLRGMLHILEVK